MKNLKDTKTKIQIILMVIASVSFSFGSFPAMAEDTSNAVDTLKLQKDQKQARLAELNKQIKDYTNQIAETRQQSNSLKNEILIYDKEIASTELQIEAKQTEIEDTNLQIAELEKIITQKIKDIADNKKVLAELIVELSQYDDQYSLKVTLGSDNFSEFLDQVQYTENYQGKIYQLVQKIKELKAKLEKEQSDLKIQLKKLEELKEGLVEAKKGLDIQRNQKQQLLDQTKGLEKNYQKLLAVSSKEENDIESEINNLDAQIRAKLGKKTISASKGALSWPMDGVLTQKYGNTGFKALGYTFHNGLDIAAPAGQAIYAAAGGTVIDTDHSDTAYGNWVAVKHTIQTASGNRQIVTLYCHMKTIKVSPGQKLDEGDLIGYEGNTGNTTKKLYGPERGYHLHFGVYDAEGFGINPGAYQKTYGSYKVPYGYTYNPLDFL